MKGEPRASRCKLDLCMKKAESSPNGCLSRSSGAAECPIPRQVRISVRVFGGRRILRVVDHGQPDLGVGMSLWARLDRPWPRPVADWWWGSVWWERGGHGPRYRWLSRRAGHEGLQATLGLRTSGVRDRCRRGGRSRGSLAARLGGEKLAHGLSRRRGACARCRGAAARRGSSAGNAGQRGRRIGVHARGRSGHRPWGWETRRRGRLWRRKVADRRGLH